MSYTKLTSTNTVTVVASDIDGNAFTLDSGYLLVTKELDGSGEETGVTVTTFFDDKLNEIGEKIEDTNENTVFVTVREYKETKPAGSTISGDYNPFEEGKENYTEVGYFQTLDENDDVLESHLWEHEILDGGFEAAKEIEEKAGGAKTTTEFDSTWAVTKSQVEGLPAGSTTITSTDAAWNDLPTAYTTGVTELALTVDSDTNETTYLKAAGSSYDVVGYKNTYTWNDPDGNSATGYSFFDNEWNFLADGGQDSYGRWYNETTEVAATDSKVAHRVEKGSWSSLDSDGNVEFSDSWEWEYAISDGSFLGGKETRNGETTTYDANWEVLSRSFDVSSLTTLDGALANIVTDMGFKMIDEAKVEAEIKSTYFSSLSGTELDDAWAAVTYQTGWEGSETFSDGGSWSNKEITLIASDGSKLGSINLHKDTWIDSASSSSNFNEGMNFNGSDWEWVGSFNVSSDGWISSNTRQEKASGTTLTNGDASSAAFYTEINKNGRVDDTALQAVLTDTVSNDIAWDGGSSDIKWEWVSYWDYAYQENGDLWGDFLGGYETNNGLKTTFNADWTVKGTDIDLSDMKLEALTSAEQAEVGKVFATAVKKSVQNWDDFNDDTSSNNTTAFKYTDKDGNEVTLTPLNNETTYYDSSDNVVGKINNWSWSDAQGNWGVGENYETYDSSNASYPWAWAGGKNTHYFDGQVDKWFDYTVNFSVGDTLSDGTTEASVSGYTQKGGFENSFDTSSWSWDYADDDTFLGGKETRDGETLIFDGNWQVTSRAGDVSELSGNVLGTDLATLIGQAGLDYNYIDSATILDQIASSYSGVADATAAGQLLYKEGWSDSQTDEWGSWENKEINLFLADGTKIGSLYLDKSSWVDTWSGSNSTVSNENVNFNGLDWNWLGNINVSSDGWINSNYRVEKSSGAALSNGDTSSADFYTQVNKNGRLTDEAVASKNIDWSDSSADITWEWISESDYSLSNESYLGGKETNRGEVIKYNSDGSMKSREVDQSSLADVDASDTFPTEIASYFIGASKKSVNNWDTEGTPTTVDSNYTAQNPGNSETTYYKADGTPLGKVMKWSWYQDADNWGVGKDYQAHDSNAVDTYWPWIWVGNSNVEEWNGVLNNRSQFQEYYADGTLKKETGSETGAGESRSWEFNYSQGGQITSGFEITDGLMVKWTKDGPQTDKIYAVDADGKEAEVDVTDTLSIDSWTLIDSTNYADQDALFTALSTDFADNGTQFVEIFNPDTMELEGIRISSSSYQVEFRGTFQVGMNEYGSVEPIGGMITTGKVLDSSGAVLSDGTDKMSVDVNYLSAILNSFGIFDSHEIASEGGYLSNYIVPQSGEFVLEIEHPDADTILSPNDLNFGIFEMDGFSFEELAMVIDSLVSISIDNVAQFESESGSGYFEIDWGVVLATIETAGIDLTSYSIPALGMVDAGGLPVDAVEISAEIQQGVFETSNLLVRGETWGTGPYADKVLIIEGSKKAADTLIVELVDTSTSPSSKIVDISTDLSGMIYGSDGYFDLQFQDIANALDNMASDETSPVFVDLNSYGELTIRVSEGNAVGDKSGEFIIPANDVTSLDGMRSSSLLLEDKIDHEGTADFLFITDMTQSVTDPISDISFAVKASSSESIEEITLTVPADVPNVSAGIATVSTGVFSVPWSVIRDSMSAEQGITPAYTTLKVTVGSEIQTININGETVYPISLSVDDPEPSVADDETLDINISDNSVVGSSLVFQFIDADDVLTPNPSVQTWDSFVSGSSGVYEIDLVDIETAISSAISDGYEKLEVGYGSSGSAFAESAEISLFDFPISGPTIEAEIGMPYGDLYIFDWTGVTAPDVIVSQKLSDGSFDNLASAAFNFVILDSLDVAATTFETADLNAFKGFGYEDIFKFTIDLDRDGVIDASEPNFEATNAPAAISLGVSDTYKPILYINEGIIAEDTQDTIVSRLNLTDTSGADVSLDFDPTTGNAVFEKDEINLTARITITDGSPYGKFDLTYDVAGDGFGNADDSTINIEEGPYSIAAVPSAGSIFLLSSPYEDTSGITQASDVSSSLFLEVSDGSTLTNIPLDFSGSGNAAFTVATTTTPAVVEFDSLDLTKDHFLSIDMNSNGAFNDFGDHLWQWKSVDQAWEFTSRVGVEGPAIELILQDPDVPSPVSGGVYNIDPAAKDGDEFLLMRLGDQSKAAADLIFKKIDSEASNPATEMDLSTYITANGSTAGEFVMDLSVSGLMTELRTAVSGGFEKLEVSHADYAGGTVSAEISLNDILAFEMV